MRRSRAPGLSSLADVANKYLACEAAEHDRIMERFLDRSMSIESAIRRACESQIVKRTNSSRLSIHPHQCRIGGKKLKSAGKLLSQYHADEIRQCLDFAALHELLKATLGKMKGVGELTVYDIAHRLGAYLGFRPTDVYLHRGVRKGAKALGLDTRRESIPMDEFPKELRRLNPEQLEDALCIYRNDIERIMSRSRKPN
jgi:hypothetical protein